MNYTYILKCKDDSLYTGWTNDLKKRRGNEKRICHQTAVQKRKRGTDQDQASLKVLY